MNEVTPTIEHFDKFIHFFRGRSINHLPPLYSGFSVCYDNIRKQFSSKRAITPVWNYYFYFHDQPASITLCNFVGTQLQVFIYACSSSLVIASIFANSAQLLL